MSEIIEQIRKEAEVYFKNSCPSHDWTHVERVYNLCMKIGEEEKADLFVLQLAALLHDIGRDEETKNPSNLNHAEISKNKARTILDRYNIDKITKEKVLSAIETHRFRGNKIPATQEAKILFDADKLDCIGAIGIARAYSWAGNKKIKLYSDKDYLGTGYEEEHSPVTEFRFKLKKIKKTLFTTSAKKIAEKRHNFMVSFFEELNKEVYG